MPASQTTANDSGTIMLFIRLWDEASESMTPAVARHILKLNFTDADKAHMHDLLEKNRESTISSVELRELNDYVSVADLLSLLHVKARIFLKTQPEANSSRV